MGWGGQKINLGLLLNHNQLKFDQRNLVDQPKKDVTGPTPLTLGRSTQRPKPAVPAINDQGPCITLGFCQKLIREQGPRTAGLAAAG